MSITDELREWAKMFDRAWFNGEGIITFSTFRPTAEDVSIREIVESIADRIDAEHKHAIGYVDDRDPETMAELGWVKLPVDADGVPWHIGDSTVLEGRAVTVCGFKAMMTEVYQCNVTNEVLKWHMYFSGGKGFAYECDKFRHVQPDTWENIIEDAMRYARETNMPYPAISHKGDELVERCRRLAGGA